MKVLFLGSIGSGKSTQAQILADLLKYSYIRSGDLVREKAGENSLEGLSCKDALEKGLLAPDEIVAKLVKERLNQMNNPKGIIFDGYIRRLSQLEVFNPGYDKVIYLSNPEELVRERLEKRERFDDTPDVIENRLKVYHTETEPLIGYFKNKEVLETVDASGSIEDVTEKLKKVLNIQDE